VAILGEQSGRQSGAITATEAKLENDSIPKLLYATHRPDDKGPWHGSFGNLKQDGRQSEAIARALRPFSSIANLRTATALGI
jgi:hypothetical protein